MRRIWNLRGCWQGIRLKEQQGTILLEAAVAIPLLAMLAMAGAAIFLWAARLYFVQLADGELEQEVQMAFVRVVEEALTAEELKPLPDMRGVDIVKKQDPLKTQVVPGETIVTRYWLHDMQGVSKLVCGRTDAPLTGDNALAGVTITDFAVDRDADRPGIYHLRIVGKSEVTKHEYSLCSAVWVPGK